LSEREFVREREVKRYRKRVDICRDRELEGILETL
jgi:hypothetical protein